MDRKEFIDSLRAHLEGEVPSPIIEKNIRFYESYISEHGGSREGERQCIQDIGDPRLIATTIITSYQMSGENEQRHEEYYEEDAEKSSEDYDKKITVPFKYKLIGIVSTAVLLIVLFFILRMFFYVAVRVIFPVAAIAIVVVLINKLLGK